MPIFLLPGFLFLFGGLCQICGYGGAMHGWDYFWAFGECVLGIALMSMGGIGMPSFDEPNQPPAPTVTPVTLRPRPVLNEAALPPPARTDLVSVRHYAEEGAAAEQAWRKTPDGKTYTRHKKAIAAARRLCELGDTSVGRAYTSRWSYEFAREVRYAWDLEES